MLVLKFIFWLSCFIIWYNYLGYALLLFVVNKLRKPARTGDTAYFPSVSFIVAAYNEEDCIEAKIINALEQDYPRDRIEYLFITDGSNDGTNAVVSRYPQIKLLFQPERSGKSAALNRVVAKATGEVLVFSDANTMLNTAATRNIARHYADPMVGGVAGEKKVIPASKEADEVGAGEGMYWKYESFLKQLDSDFHSVVGAAGELFSLRRNLFESVGHQVILDDFIISMRVAEKGYRVIYEPGAYAMELPSFSIQDEGKRKVRIAAGGFQAMTMLSSLLRFWRSPKLSFLYISHRVLRWTLSPIGFILAFISNAILCFSSNPGFYRLLFVLQVLFYLMAVAASIIPSKKGVFKIFRLAYYFVFMNISVVQGFFRFLRGRQPAAWEKARRSQEVLGKVS